MLISQFAVMFPDEQSGSLCSWDSRNTDRKRLLALGNRDYNGGGW